MQRARLIRSGALHPFLNMAQDEAIAPAPPVVRLYRFDPPGLSLGYFQRAGDFPAAELNRLSAVLVRRATGGAAILHADDVTFAIVARPGDPLFAGPIAASYRRVHDAIALGLRSLGVDATARSGHDGGAGAPRADEPVCFHAPTSFDLMLGSKKLVGSAQRRTRERVLHHGSIPLRKNPLATDAASIEDAIGRRPTREEVESALAGGFAAAFGWELVESEVSADEARAAERLVLEKYGTDVWNRMR